MTDNTTLDPKKESKSTNPPWRQQGAIGWGGFGDLEYKPEKEIVNEGPVSLDKAHQILGSIDFKLSKDFASDLVGSTLDAGKDLFSQLTGWEKNPAPQPIEQNSENGNAEILAQEKQLRYEREFNQTLIRNDETMQQQKEEEALRESQRLEVDAAAIVENMSGRSSQERAKIEVKPPKLSSGRPKSPQEIAEARAYARQFESEQQGWAEDIVKDTQKEESIAVADNQAVVNLNAVMEGGTGGAKANIAPVTGAG